MGLCASSTPHAARDAPASATEDLDAADADYKKQLDKIDDARDNNLLSIRTFPVSQALGYGYLILPAVSDIEEGDVALAQPTVTTLDGTFSRVNVRGHEKSRVLRLRTFRRKHLLRGGMPNAIRRVKPYIAGIEAMHRLRPCRFILPLEHAFYDKNSCVLVMGMYDVELGSIMRRGLKLEENAAMSIVASLALALKHMHAASPPAIAGSENLVADHVLVNSQGHVSLSLLPTAATKIGIVEEARGGENGGEEADLRAASPEVLAEGDSSITENTQESPGAKYRVQTKQSEVRSGQNPADIAEETRLKARDWLLLGRLMASLCGLAPGSEAGKGTAGNTDADLLQTIRASSELSLNMKNLLAGLLEPEDEKRWRYENLRSALVGEAFPWEKLEDAKESARPPPFASHELLRGHIDAIMAEHATLTAKFEQGTETQAETHATSKTEDNDAEIEAAKESESKASPDADSEDEYDLDSIPSEDSLAMLDEDELLPWEVSEVLSNWDFKSTVASLHQLSNFTNSKTMASFAAYDAQFQGNTEKRGAPGAGRGALREDLSGIGKILEADIAKQEERGE